MAAPCRRNSELSRRTNCPRSQPQRTSANELTPRERAVLEGIAGGLNNAEIAASLGLSEKTVRNHITRVLDKIGVDHRYQATVLARDAGLGMK
jgi:DNA-binding NarL/FixJ family response regulator